MPEAQAVPPEVAALADTAGPAAVVNVRLPRPLLALVDREARRLSCNRSALLRALLCLGLDQLRQGQE